MQVVPILVGVSMLMNDFLVQMGVRMFVNYQQVRAERHQREGSYEHPTRKFPEDQERNQYPGDRGGAEQGAGTGGTEAAQGANEEDDTQTVTQATQKECFENHVPAG